MRYTIGWLLLLVFFFWSKFIEFITIYIFSNIFRFEHMFSDNEFRLAAMTNSYFKLSWLSINEDHIRRAKTLLKGKFCRFQETDNESDAYKL